MMSVTRSIAGLFLSLVSLPPSVLSQVAVSDTASLQAGVGDAGGRIVLEATGLIPEVPVVFSAVTEASISVTEKKVEQKITVTCEVLHGDPEKLTLEVFGDGLVSVVNGDGLGHWGVRHGVGDGADRRFLDFWLAEAETGYGDKPFVFVVSAAAELGGVPADHVMLTLGPGDASGFRSDIKIESSPALAVDFLRLDGFYEIDQTGSREGVSHLASTGENALVVRVGKEGSTVVAAEMRDARLEGELDLTSGTVHFSFSGEVEVNDLEGASLEVLAGRVALRELPAGDGYQVRLKTVGGKPVYEVVFDREGVVPVQLDFDAGISEDGRWHRLDFRVPAGVVVPVVLRGWEDGVRFQNGCPVVPVEVDGRWRGFLPAGGAGSMAWGMAQDAGEGKLFFTSEGMTETSVSAGRLRQSHTLKLRVLQGKLEEIDLVLENAGEILSVSGTHVMDWKINDGGGERRLHVRLSRPLEAEGSLLVESQSTLGGFPAAKQPLRVRPEGAVRHSGYVRLSNVGAVRLGVSSVEAMTQLSPEQFPGRALPEGVRQVFVYRYPSAQYSYTVNADQILPEVTVSQVSVYEFTESDRILQANIELDIREAPLREWALEVPADYAVVAVQGAEVADYAVGGEVSGGRRTLKVMFREEVVGRQLVHLRLENNIAAAAGEWVLSPLVFPGAKSVRGHIGLASSPGYRLVPEVLNRLAEMPLSYFPGKFKGLQHAFRIRGGEADSGLAWGATVQAEMLTQSVQADVFHLYSLKEGVAYGSVLVNYFVVGAPVGEWRVSVPEGVGNITVDGQDVRTWQQEGNTVVVTLQRPVLDAYTLLVTFEQPMSARGGMVRPGEVMVLGVQSERGYVQVVSPSQVKFDVTEASPALLEIEASEMPAEFRLLSSSPSLATYQYTARPFELVTNVEWFSPGETVEKVIDFAALESRVSKNGEVVTNARFFVKTRGQKALRFQLPEGAQLWQAQIDGAMVNARTDGGEMMLPLPVPDDPNSTLEVGLRFGMPEKKGGGRVELEAPVTGAPVLMTEWKVMGDRGRRLVPDAEASKKIIRPTLTETGFEWVRWRAPANIIMTLLVLTVTGFSLRRLGRSSGRLGWLVLLMGVAAIVLAGGLTVQSAVERRANKQSFTAVDSVSAPDQVFRLTLENIAPWEAMLSWGGVVSAVLGSGCLVRVFLKKKKSGSVPARLWQLGGWSLLMGGLLAQRMGAVPFFFVTVVLLFFYLTLPEVKRLWSGRAPAVVVLLLAIIFGAWTTGEASGAPVVDELGVLSADSVVQRWQVGDGRLNGEIDFQVSGEAGDRFLLLESPGVLSGFEGEGLRLTKTPYGESSHAYLVVVESPGTWGGNARFELPVREGAPSLPLLTGVAAVQRVEVVLDQAGWEFTSPSAVRVEALSPPSESTGYSGARILLGSHGARRIDLRPLTRDIDLEETAFVVETANLFIPSPGITNGRHRISVRPKRGRVQEIACQVPDGFTVSDVVGEVAGLWRFDPESGRLRVAIEPTQATAFSILVETQGLLGALPAETSVAPLKVPAAASELGTVGLAFGKEAQLDKEDATGLLAINLRDFDTGLLPEVEGILLQKAYRYPVGDGEESRLDISVAPVAPEIRVVEKQVVSLGAERLVVSSTLTADITRAGVFSLSFDLPEGLEIESVSSPALGHWTEADTGGARRVTLHLTGRTVGRHEFLLTLAGASPGARATWRVPRVTVREAGRQTGELLLSPEQGIQLRAVSRRNVSLLDSREAGVTQAGSFAYRILQNDWSLDLSIEELKAWVTAQALQDVTFREGLVRTRTSIRYRIENAAVRTLRVRLPDLDEPTAGTLRATGTAVGDFVRVLDEDNIWEIRFERGMLGDSDVVIEYQKIGGSNGEETDEAVPIINLLDVRQQTYYVAVRVSDRISIRTEEEAGWQQAGWAGVPNNLRNKQDGTVPALVYRVAEPEAPLAIHLKRHEVADSLRQRVTRGVLTSIFSLGGGGLTAVEFDVEAAESGTMQVALPEGATLFNTFVNGESAAVASDGDTYLFHVAASDGW